MKDAAYAIHALIHGEGVCVPPCVLCEEVQDLIGDLRDEHAHELAEKQRGYAEEEWSGGDARMILRRRVARHLADLVDPNTTA